ncbi:conserved hypothetical protein [Desulfatibacillum aliphaticivorans]|uniref:Uncharacterized protein n=1 Tax=Desulfatibacillum aliphaticivorans TaxID=218208 RepID=B8FC43_DESAL|nr:hypothetical protein [Desulfatibacillum aliphaticivorans]ACL05248.1 conserved hypothetical protein [Desulfatibacillum aliphaticivorans]
MGILETIPASTIGVIVSLLGWPGLIFIVWYVDQRRIEKIQADNRKAHQDAMSEFKDTVNEILIEYKEDMARLARFYENNVELVTNYQKLANDLADIIHLNTQAQTNLVNAIQNNTFCPMVRKETGK